MTRKQQLWATLIVLAAWTAVPTALSYGWSFQDYFQDWASARNWWEGIPVYSPHSETVNRYLGLDFDHLADGKLYALVATLNVNAHPPSSVLFFLPFALLPYGLSYVTWNVLSAVCLGLGAAIVARELDLTPSWRGFLFVGILGLAAGPVFEQMVFGQTNCVTLAFLALSWRAHRRGGQVEEGCWLGAAAALKLFPLLLFLIPLGARRWRSLGSALGTMMFIVGLSLTLFGTDIWSEFATKGMASAVAWGDLWPNASLSGFWKKLFVSQNLGNLVPVWRSWTAYWIAYSLSWAALGLTTAWLIVIRHRDMKGDRSYAIGICAMLLLSPTCWPHYFLMMIVPLGILWAEHRESAWHRRLIFTSFLLLFLPAGVYMVLCPMNVVSPHLTLTTLAAQTYTLLGLWGLAAAPALQSLFQRAALRPPDAVMPSLPKAA